MIRNAHGIRNEQFNRLTFQVSPGKVRCLLNGQLFYEDTDAPLTSPWLMLYADTGRRPVFRNFTLTGKPEVLSEVKLSGGDSLGGWMTHIHGGVIPARLSLKEQAEGQAVDRWGNPIQPGAQAKEPKYDWLAKGGEIIGRKLEKNTEKSVPSNLAYFRPLRPGETLRYEFYYEAGKTHVHPSLGRLAFLLEPDGVKLHWLTDAEEWTGLAVDNVVEDPAGKKGDKLALKAGDWNALTLTTTADGVKIELNGAVVYEGRLSADMERLFGLFHYRDKTAVRVRKVVLTGNWAKEPPTAIDFATKPANPAEAKARRWQLGEKYYFLEAGDVVEKARELPPAEWYKVLADWVLPNDSRSSFQLAGVDKPLDVLGMVDRKEQPDGRRIMLGSRLDAPCLELIAAAKAGGILDELAERIAKAESPASDDLFRRSKAAMLAAVRAAQGRDADAAEAAKQLLEFPKKWPRCQRPRALARSHRGRRHARPSGLLRQVTDIAETVNKSLEQSMLQDKFPNASGGSGVAALRARALVLAQPDGVRRPYGSDAGFASGCRCRGLDSSSRSQGWNVPHWSFRDDVVTHFPGHSEDYLILRTPLRGDFEVTCELRVQGWTEAHIRYGAHQFDFGHDRKKYKMHTTMRQNGRDVTISPPMPETKETVYKFRLAVKDGWFRAFVDDRELIVEKIGANPDPWLMLHCHHQNTGEIKNFKINGPTIRRRSTYWRTTNSGCGGHTSVAWLSDAATGRMVPAGSSGERNCSSLERNQSRRRRGNQPHRDTSPSRPSTTSGRCWRTGPSNTSSSTTRTRRTFTRCSTG